MKFSLYQFRFVFAALLVTTLFSSNINAQAASILSAEIDGCCVVYNVQFNPAGGTYQFHPDCPNPDPASLTPCDNPDLLMQGDVVESQMLIKHCYEENGTYQAYFNQTLPAGNNNGSGWIVNITDCEIAIACWTTIVNSPDGCELGSYTFCCDGSLSITATPQATKVKIYNTADCPSVCTLCNLWGSPACNDNTWTYPVGTVNESNDIWIEFQSTSPWDEFDCEWNSGLINLSNLYDQYCNIESKLKSQDSKETISDLEINISPNPASDFINIKTNSNGLQEVTVFSLSGKKLISEKEAGKFTQLDVSSLSSGFYFINVLDVDSGITHSEKIVIID